MPSRTPILDGAVDTPAELARELAARLFASAGPVAVLDPACGSGELLLAALQAAGGAPSFAACQLFGIELQPERTREARERVLAGVDPSASAAELAEVAHALEAHIVCGDALDPALDWPAGTHVLANPPWMSLSGRQAAELSPERLALYREHWSVLRGGWPSLHGAFLERIAGHLAGPAGATNGPLRARILIPTPVCELERYGPTRAAVRASARLDAAPVDLGDGQFAGVTQPTTLLSLAGGAWLGADPSAASVSASGSALASTSISTPTAPWLESALPPLERPTEREQRLLAHLTGFPRLPAKTFADPGVHTGNSALELVFKSEQEARARAASAALVRVGRDLSPYRLGEPTHWLRTDLRRTPTRRFRIPALEAMRAFPILLRQTAAHPIAALHTEPTYFRNSLLACRGVAELDPAFLVAVLNSPLIALWHRTSHRDSRQRNFPQVKVGHLAALPFPFLARSESPALHDELALAVREVEREPECSAERIAEIEALVEQAFGLAPFE